MKDHAHAVSLIRVISGDVKYSNVLYSLVKCREMLSYDVLFSKAQYNPCKHQSTSTNSCKLL